VSEYAASCRCGSLRAIASGDPVRISVCHCLACQKRTGSAFSAQARWPADCVEITGPSKQWQRTADSGQTATYHFCSDCGSTVYYVCANYPDVIAFPLGALDDPYIGTPDYSVFERRKHEWIDILGDDIERLD
jgi:hypothetical protein